jgi:hypothetical protein
MVRIAATSLLTVFVSSMAIAKSFSSQTGISDLNCFLYLLPIVGFGIFFLVVKHRYRPSENHLGMVYWLGRFHRFVNPDEWTFLVPYFETVKFESPLSMRTAEFELRKVELQDGLTVDAHFKVFFKTDLRLTPSENLPQVLTFDGQEWPIAIIKTGMEDIARNQVLLGMSLDRLKSLRKSRVIKNLFSREIAARVGMFGILINEAYGAMLVNVQPNEAYANALQKNMAAKHIGQAAIERLNPVLSAIKQMRRDDARSALLLEIASKVLEVTDLPDIALYSSEEDDGDYLSGEDRRKGPRTSIQRKSNSIKHLPLVE